VGSACRDGPAVALRDVLPAVAEAITSTSPPPESGGGPLLCPLLRTSYCPALRPPPPEPWDPTRERLWAFTRAEPEPEAEAEPLGLSAAQNPKRAQGRTGRNGITANGRRCVMRAAHYLEDHRERVAFWTVTLPPAAMREVIRRDCWAEFQNRIRQELSRQLAIRGMCPQVVGVAELHPQRSMRERMPCPHLHVLFEGRRTRWNCWVLDRHTLDGIIRAALGTVGVRGVDVGTAGNVQPVRRSVAAYLGKYLSKGGRPEDLCLAQEEGLPKQWWFWTAPLRREVLRLVVRLPWEFMAWVAERREIFEAQGLITFGRYRIADPRAPAVYWFRWCSLESLALVVAEWQEDLWEADWWRENRPLHDRARSVRHSVRHQHL